MNRRGPIIEARHLGKTFGGTTAVNDVSFTVHPGVVTGFLGPNGAGKTTALRLMLGLERGDGVTTFDGANYASLPTPQRVVGAMLDSEGFHPGRSAYSHLAMYAAAAGLPQRRVGEVLDIVGVADVADASPATFSLGMTQRLGLALALLGDPTALILDEPANGLDPEGIAWLRRLLSDLAAEGRTVFVSSHQLAQVHDMAADIVVIGGGQLAFAGPIDEFVGTVRASEVRVTTPDVQRLLDALAAKGLAARVDGGDVVATGQQSIVGDIAFEAGVRVHGLLTEQATLEDAFLAATDSTVQHRGTSARRRDQRRDVEGR